VSVAWAPKHLAVDVIDVAVENCPRRPSIVEAEELSQLESHVITDKTPLGCVEHVVQQASSVDGRQYLENSGPFRPVYSTKPQNILNR